MCISLYTLITPCVSICQGGRRKIGQILFSYRPNQVEGYVEERTEFKNSKIRTGRRRDRQTDIWTCRQTDRQTYEHGDKKTDERIDVTTMDGCIIDILVWMTSRILAKTVLFLFFSNWLCSQIFRISYRRFDDFGIFILFLAISFMSQFLIDKIHFVRWSKDNSAQRERFCVDLFIFHAQVWKSFFYFIRRSRRRAPHPFFLIRTHTIHTFHPFWYKIIKKNIYMLF